MSRLEQLLGELCPDGVPFRALGEIGTVVRGKRFVKDDMIDVGVPCIHYGEIYTKYGVSATESYSFTSPERAMTLRFAQPGDVIMASAGETIADIGKSVAWLGDDPIVIHDACYAYSSPLDPEYVSYYFSSRSFRDQIKQHISSSKISSISTQSVAKARIPVPPLDVQREIVRILDVFTELEAELETELRARREQYKHYQDQLLTFTDEAVDWGMLGDIGRISMCRRVFKAETTSIGDVPFFKIGTFGGEPDAFITRDLYNDYRSRYPFPKPGEVLISAAGTIGRTVVYDGAPGYFQDSNIVWIENDESVVSNAYLRYWYRVVQWRTDGGTIRRLYNDNIRRAKIAVPRKSEQDRIVRVLDAFEALVNDRRIGLPAEIAARRKQYTYYRDKLFNFEEAAS
ncbi:restriction endonuclease subunit S [Microbacterium sp. NPDC078428]|uniref:restriction endonuclease subunit S n=1 Tax=Microbacterium sp. NPDC078428 TaxID=3364190 RepID=UPI0037CA7310